MKVKVMVIKTKDADKNSAVEQCSLSFEKKVDELEVLKLVVEKFSLPVDIINDFGHSKIFDVDNRCNGYIHDLEDEAENCNCRVIMEADCLWGEDFSFSEEGEFDDEF